MSAFITQQKAAGFAVELTCRTLGTSPSAFYHRATGVLSSRAQEDAVLLERIREVHRKNYECYGSLRVWKALARKGVDVGRGRVERLMAADGLVGAKRRGKAWKTTVADPAGSGLPDLVNRQFTADRPNATWVADFTYLKSWEGVGFFSFVLDVYSRRIVGWQLASHMRTDLVLDALKMALGTRPHGADVQLIHHSDRGSQYTSFDFTQTLEDHDVLGSVGSTGDAYDNAMAESFVDSFKTELIRDRVWQSRTQMELAVVEWVGWYNHDRLHSALGHIPPDEFETLYAVRSRFPLPS
ncbi:IS3 family transposase ISBt3 [Paraconexibacter sp. AEG42_29]|uniref:IS3 family transposase ISBt3 n=1 Tax=Paraconexibacter sp. AEG42_29 TaxID=2997339 RepID=A0AAU7B0H5_9ACTN